ncbi:MAG TPA: hypothetical protein VLA52_00430 [Thermohalobaculum sp.]|nr:hypothetical protein [Thermohalobaculum sp.]
MDRDKQQTGSGKDQRAERLAEALRQNLRRRKAQARARRDDAAADSAPAGTTQDKDDKTSK